MQLTFAKPFRKTTLGLFLTVSTTLLSNETVSGQVVYGDPANLRWEASQDDGQTWTASLLTVEPTQPSVLIRAWCQFPVSVPNAYFGGLAFDARVSEGPNVGGNDTISSIQYGVLTTQGRNAVRRFGNVLKIDHADDDQPPGEGPNWLSIGQSPPQFLPTPNYANPIVMFNYTLVLDGTAGDRTIDGVYSRFLGNPPGPHAIVYRNDQAHLTVTFAHPLIEHQLVVRVVPTPGALAAGLALLGFATRRHRGNKAPQTSRLLQ